MSATSNEDAATGLPPRRLEKLDLD